MTNQLINEEPRYCSLWLCLLLEIVGRKKKLFAGGVIAIIVVSGVLLISVDYDVGVLLNFLMGLDDPILIESDQDFEGQGWPGDGTASDPYVIAGKTIRSLEDRPCIEIRNTTVAFTVKYCNLESSSGEPAIRLIGVRNALIQNSTIRSKTRGIEAVDVSYSAFIDNSISGFVNAGSDVVEITSQEGIFGVGGEGNEFSGNRFSNILVEALRLRFMDNSYITNNVISNSKVGVHLFESSYSIIFGNEIFNSGYGGSLVSVNNGIEIDGCGALTINDNLIHDNAGYGIQLVQSYETTIHGNIVLNNTLGGIYTESSEYISVMNNTVANNGGAGVSFIGVSWNHFDNFLLETTYIHHNSASGIYLYLAEDGEVRDNRIAFNGEWGIHILECLNISESNNLFDSNTLGDISP